MGGSERPRSCAHRSIPSIDMAVSAWAGGEAVLRDLDETPAARRRCRCSR